MDMKTNLLFSQHISLKDCIGFVRRLPRSIQRVSLVVGLLSLISLSTMTGQVGMHSVKIQMTLTNNHGLSSSLIAGVHELATNNLDMTLGENELPPVPPTEIFDTRFVSPSAGIDLGEGSATDLRPWRTGGTLFTETYRIKFQAGRTWPSVTLLMPASFPNQIKLVKVDGKTVNAGDSIVSQFATGDFTLAIDFNLSAVKLTANPNTLTFSIGNRDSTLPPTKTVQITPDVPGASWYAETDVSWIALRETRGTGDGNLSIGLSDMNFFDGRTTGEVHVYHSHDDDPVVITVNVDYLTAIHPVWSIQNVDLEQNYPNPFSLSSANAMTRIDFVSHKAEHVTIQVYDLLGRMVVILPENSRDETGHRTALWNGRSSNGHLVSPGLYIYRLEAESVTLSRPMIVTD